MAWDTEGTQRKILDAALAEFTEHGPTGTTIERIASQAGVNKERIYHYFGNREALFARVVRDESVRLTDNVLFDPDVDDPMGTYAGRIFDYHLSRPQMVRLLLWDSLSSGGGATDGITQEHYDEKSERFARAQAAGAVTDALEPGELVFAIMALNAWWFAVPRVAELASGHGVDEAGIAARREAVVKAARLLARRDPA
ncbi:TetR/AcrR family transcriptional regulator [Microbacterium paludicola]|uniref:TetR/AcrR family transcriptional regulator n=1 Tax=Microbacterium paludicola TaxID=300019 RepID=UPI0031E2E587